MFLQSEIKDFIKNTLILTLFFTLILNLSWGYIGPMLGVETNASSANSKKFQETNINYLGSIATALSISIGQKDKILLGTPVGLAQSAITISAVIANPTEWQKRLIGANMSMIQSYANLLSTDILSLLDRSTDRANTLDDHITLLEDYGEDITERIIYIDEQIRELNNIINESTQIGTSAKANLDTSYKWLDYTGVDDAIEKYTKAKTADTRARIYLAYLKKFRSSYIALQTKNKELITALKNNREALIKRSSVVIPTSWTNILKDLHLIETEAEYQSRIKE
jgi:hypothetical protein